ncbi:hypothetical protein WPS_04050 [Vulcanimicrobium alpinum]|uniref:CHRD domain-containing protein n=1 Tax=Vulcanimicrobium alpinum TaxID=3016050 RepID=A0AAN2C899_UNVUL|nr:hypothetical protein [Vulcanimicrobium alpinum]BDE05129.1 hypothetical protein WPS_04050 [Vulcanimicrobium alpinum]
MKTPSPGRMARDALHYQEVILSLKFVTAAALAAAALTATAAGAATPIQIPILAQNGSGEHGTATLLQGAAGVIVRLRMSGAGDEPQPAHIHKGTCAKLDPKPTYPLHNAVNGFSETTVPNTTLADLQKGEWAINVHKSTKEIPVYVACADLGKK